MAQLIYISGEITSRGNLEESEKGNSYLHLIIDESLNGRNEIPVVFFGKNAETAAKSLEKGQIILISAEISVYVNTKDGKTWRNLSVVGKTFKIQKALSSVPKKTTAKKAKEEVKKALDQQKPANTAKTEETTQQSGMDTYKEKSATEETVETPNTVEDTTDSDVTDDLDDFDQSLFDDLD